MWGDCSLFACIFHERVSSIYLAHRFLPRFLGCVVSPGFEFRDMQMFTVREMRDLCSAFPPSEDLKQDIETLSLPDLEDSTSISPK